MSCTIPRIGPICLFFALFLALAPTAPRAQADLTDALPDAVSARGTGLIEQVWLGQPVKRYRHGILGDRIEAGTLYARLSNGRIIGHRLGSRFVFEDLTARLADLNGNGQDEIVVVQSSLEKGSALAVFGLRAGRLQALARTPWIGTANRWLNPAGIADYDGDGVLEVALVRTPHIGGTLQFWQLDGGEMRAMGELYGFSNHAIGSRIQDLSVTLDWNSDGLPDLVLPEIGRKSIAVVSLRGGQVTVLTSIPMPDDILGPMKVGDDGMSVIIPLVKGQEVTLSVPR
ncbi:MAG: VCBS repeat-containing protein [Minwuia sp.]|nr:VCBS repeat-containing protein [Minwuia sp.]